MICRHSANDPSCSKNGGGYAAERSAYDAERIRKLEKQLADSSPDASNYEVEKVEMVGPHIVMQVKYPNCAKCAFEGMKVMVFFNIQAIDVLRWKRIDPHFRGPEKKRATDAPSPAARFPATPEGWNDAVDYARRKSAK